MPRFATTIKFISTNNEDEVDFSGCRGYIDEGLQFLDDRYRETHTPAADGTPHFQTVDMGATAPHRGNSYGVRMENVEASKVIALIALNVAAKAAGSYIKVSLRDAMIELEDIPSKADPNAPFWVTTGRESEGMISDVTVRLIALA